MSYVVGFGNTVFERNVIW